MRALALATVFVCGMWVDSMRFDRYYLTPDGQVRMDRRTGQVITWGGAGGNGQVDVLIP